MTQIPICGRDLLGTEGGGWSRGKMKPAKLDDLAFLAVRNENIDSVAICERLLKMNLYYAVSL